jgi:hypothetical protein
VCNATKRLTVCLSAKCTYPTGRDTDGRDASVPVRCPRRAVAETSGVSRNKIDGSLAVKSRSEKRRVGLGSGLIQFYKCFN